MCSVTKSCPTVCNAMDCSKTVSFVHGISQARILEWVAVSFCKGFSRPRDRTCISFIGKWISLPLRHLGSPHTTLDLSQEVFCLLLLTVYYSLVLLAMKIQSSGTHFPFSTALCHWGSECFAFQSMEKVIHRNMKMQSVD